MSGLAESLFPRSSKLAGMNPFHPRALLGAGLDVASFPGRAYASLGRMGDESYLDALGRTGPRYVAGQGEGDEMADAILRDPLTPVGFGLGSLLRGARPLVGMAADLGTNAAGMAADQYATTGGVNGADIGTGAGMGVLLGLGGMAKGGKRSMISPEERAANFRNWFGDSKVVDKAGKPLTVYHGGADPVDAFTKRPERGGGFGAGYFSSDPDVATAYATTGQPPGSELARKFRDGAVTNTHLSIRNPINENTTFEQFFNGDKDRALSLVEDITDRNEFEDMRDIAVNGSDKDFWSGIESLELSGLNVNHELYTPLLESSPLLRSLGNYSGGEYYQGLIKPTAFDGIIHNDFENGGKTFIPFKPTQIKSATGNRGTFDPNDPNITHFAGTNQGPSRNRATTRLERQAAQVAYDKYGRPREESAARPVSTFRGLGSLLSSPSDTYYTRGSR
jgi:hypothetical protein